MRGHLAHTLLRLAGARGQPCDPRVYLILEISGGFIREWLDGSEAKKPKTVPDCYWLRVAANYASVPELQEPIRNPARFPWHEVTKVQHYWLDVGATTRSIQIREEPANDEVLE